MSEELDPMVLPVRHQNVPLAVHGDSLQTFELPVVLTPPTERPKESAVRVENLDSVISRVGNEDETLLVDSHTPAQIQIYSISRSKPQTNLGNLNCPSSVPSEPKVVRTFPLTSNIWSLWLFESETMTLLVLLTAM